METSQERQLKSARKRERNKRLSRKHAGVMGGYTSTVSQNLHSVELTPGRNERVRSRFQNVS